MMTCRRTSRSTSLYLVDGLRQESKAIVVRPVAARRTRPTITNAAAQVVVSAASVVLSPSIVGLINSATPGIVKTLSNSGLIVGIN